MSNTIQIDNDAVRIAAIDVGSNSVKMLAAEKTATGFLSLCSDLITVRLQSGLSADGTLDSDALQRAEDAICTLAQMARDAGAQRVCAFGTSALRDAKNASVLIERVQRRAQVELRIISGLEEASTAYHAAAAVGDAMVVNPGGGSIELIIGRDRDILSGASAHIGAVSLMQMAKGKMASEAITLARGYIEVAARKLTAPIPAQIITSGGTPVAAAMVLQMEKEHAPGSVDGFILTKDVLTSLFLKLHGMEPEALAQVPGMQKGRADILPYGIAILLATMEQFGVPAFRVCERGNLWGLLELV